MIVDVDGAGFEHRVILRIPGNLGTVTANTYFQPAPPPRRGWNWPR